MENLTSLFDGRLSYALGWMILQSLWQVLAVAILAAILLLGFVKKAQSRYLVSVFAILAIMISSASTFMYYWSGYKSSQVGFKPVSKVTSTVLPGNSTTFFNTGVEHFNSLTLQGVKEYCAQHLELIAIFWFIGAVLFTIRLLGGLSYVYYLRNRMNFPADEYWQDLMQNIQQRLGIIRTIGLMESALVRVPMVIGHLKPMILFPLGAINHLQPEEVEAILAHEMAHIRRHDFLINIIHAVAEAIFYFHPAFWWISAQIRTERENCCDDLAIGICGDTMSYARSLVRVQEMAFVNSGYLSLAISGHHRGALYSRVQRLVDPGDRKQTFREKLSALLILSFIFISTSLATMSAVGKHQNNSFYEKQMSESKMMHTYIKYENEKGELDSFVIAGFIKNGIYHLDADLFQASLEVLNNYVVHFKINGVEQDRINFEKFSKIIHEIIESNRQAQKQTEMQAALAPENAQEAEILPGKRNGSTGITTIMPAGLSALASKDNDKYALNMNRPMLTSDMTQNVLLQTAEGSVTGTCDAPAVINIHQLRIEILNQLQKDGLFQNDELHVLLWSNYMLINNKNVDPSLFKNYLQLYEKVEGKKLEGNRPVSLVFMPKNIE